MTKLEELYNQWRTATSRHMEDEGACRESFSIFIGVEVSFEEMEELEDVWNELNGFE